MIAPPADPRAQGAAPSSGPRRRPARALLPLLAAAAAVALPALLLAVAHGGGRTAPYGDRLTSHPASGPAPAAEPELRYDRHAVRAYAPGTGTPLWTYARDNRRPVGVHTAPGHAFTLWDDGMVTDTVRPAGAAGPAAEVRWHRTVPGAGASMGRAAGATGTLAALGPAGRILVVVTPGHVAAYRTEDGDLRWVITAGRGCSFTPGSRVQLGGTVLIARPCADPAVPWARQIIAVDEHGRVTPDRRPEK
ncbi:hypothetical protein [Streptomyces sp. NPDC051211]|uniref:hypothetical protein n=1 Tax=Streptomyces sp. NPDC051211 TaxID=3154643 RepID=UPI003450646C